MNTRLDRAFWVDHRAGESLQEAEEQRQAVQRELQVLGEEGATKEELARARRRERVTDPGRAPSAVHRLTPVLFGQVNLPKPGETEGVELTAAFGKVPAPPPFTPAPVDVPGQPRPYQREILQDLDGTGDGESVLVTAPTGAGKTVILSRYIAGLRRRGKSVAVMAHTQELVSQAKATIEKTTGQPVGLVQGGSVDWSKPVTVVSHGTVADNPRDTIPETFRPDVLIIDEAHHAAADGFQNIIRAMGPRKLVGFTATPYRGDGQDLDNHFQKTICRVETADLVKSGYLVPPTIVDVALRDKGGKSQDINDAGNLPELYAKGIAHARNQGRKKIIVFVTSGRSGRATDVVQSTTDSLAGLGLKVGEVLGSTSGEERERAVNRFKRLKEGVLINYGTLNEGFDAPSTDAIILGRNVGSPGTLAQIVGRGMRPDPANPAKTDVLVYNYSSRPAGEIEDLVLNQIQGNREVPIECGPPAPRIRQGLTPLQLQGRGGPRPAGQGRQLPSGQSEGLQRAVALAISRARDNVPAPSVRVAGGRQTGGPMPKSRRPAARSKPSRRKHSPGARGVPR